MGATLTIFVLLSFSVFVIRVASVALRLTGLTETSARFQALSAFTGQRQYHRKRGPKPKLRPVEEFLL